MDYEGMSYKELQQLAKERGIPANKKKAELIELLVQQDDNQQHEEEKHEQQEELAEEPVAAAAAPEVRHLPVACGCTWRRPDLAVCGCEAGIAHRR